MSSIQNYLQKYPFNPKPVSNKFAIFINDEDKLITSAIGNNREIENTLKLKINNELHKLLCIKLLVHLNSFTLLNALTIRELKHCEKIYDNDIFMKEKKNMLGFQIGILNKNKKFAIKNFEEWKINSQDSSDKILEINEEGDLYNDKKQTIGFYNGNNDLKRESLVIEEENTYLKIQEENKKEYDEMSGLIDICNICGYWK